MKATAALSLAKKYTRKKGHFDARNLMQRFCLFYGEPIKINNVNDIEKAAKIFASYDIVIFTSSIHDPLHSWHADTVEIVSEMRKINPFIKIFGYIHAHDSETKGELTVQQAKDITNAYKAMGINGIFIDAFGYDYRVSRVRQNELVTATKGEGAKIIVNSWRPDYVFSSQALVVGDFDANPDQIAPVVNSDDYYIFENHIYRRGYETEFQEANDAERIYQSLYYRFVPQDEYGGKTYFEQFGTQTLSLNGLEEPNERFFKECYLVALGTGCHAFGMSGSSWSDPNQVHYRVPKIEGTQEELWLEEMSFNSSEYELNFKTRIRHHVIDVIWNQHKNIRSAYSFPDDPYVFQCSFSGTLNVDSGIQITLNRENYYPSLLNGDTAEIIAQKVSNFNYGSEWTTTSDGATVNFQYHDGNPQYSEAGEGSGDDNKGNYVYLNSSKGVGYEYSVLTIATTVIRRIMLDGEFLDSAAGVTELRPHNPKVGATFYDTTLQKMVYWTGTKYETLGATEPQEEPYEVPTDDMFLWLDASSIQGVTDGATMSSWADLSPNTISVGQASSSREPQYVEGQANGKAIVRFDGTEKLFDISSHLSFFDNVGEITVVAVVKYTLSANDSPVMYASLTDSSTTPLYSLRKSDLNEFEMTGKRNSALGTTTVTSTQNVTEEYVIQAGTFDYALGQWTQEINGAMDGSGTISSTGNSESGDRYIRIGKQGSDLFAGDIAELIIYKRKLATDEKTNMYKHLSEKWGITLSS